METKDSLTKALAIAGTVLVWFPLLAPLLLSFIFFAAERRFLFDYLMPMELFLFALIGGGLLLWATLRVHGHVKLVAWGLGVAALMLFGVQWFAEVTGLASDQRGATGWIWGLALAWLAIYILGLIAVGTGGALLVIDLFKRRPASI